MALGTRTQFTTNSATVTVPSGSNRLAEVLVIFEASTAPSSITATINGVSMTSAGTAAATNSGAGSQSMVAALYMLESSLPTAGNYTCAVTITGGTGVQGRLHSFACHTDRAQQAPLYTTGFINTGTALNIGPLATKNDAYGISGVANTGAGRTNLVGGSWTERFDQNGSAGDTQGAGADITYSSASTDTVGWTASVSSLYAGVMLVLDPYVAGPTITSQPTAQTARLNGDATTTATFSVSATASGGSLTYDWELETSVGGGVYANLADGNGATWTGQAASSCVGTFTDTTLTGRRLRCNVTDSNGTTTTDAVALTVLEGPVLSSSTASTNGSGVASVTMVTDDELTANGELLLVTATGRGGAVIGRTTLRPQDFTAATLTASTFALTANGIATTTLTGDVGTASGIPVNFTVQRIQMNAADSFVSASPTDIDSDGVDTSTITVSASALIDGEYVPLPGIAASQVVVAATGTGNTLVQPSAATDVLGVATATLKSTEATATKTVSVTIAGLAMTDTATVTTDAGAPPPPSGTDPDYTATFESGSFTGENADGFTWGSSVRSTVSSEDAYAGTYSLKQRYQAAAAGADSSTEQRFNLGTNVTELWVEFYLKTPSNYVHRTEAPDNNKFFRIWGDAYASANKVGASTRGSTGDESILWYEYNYKTWGDGTLGHGPTGFQGGQVPYGTTAMKGAWTQIRMYFKMVSATDADDAEYRLWYDGVLQDEFTNIPQKYDSAKPYWNQGYFLGAANSGFTDETVFYIDNVKFWWTNNPGWF